MGITPETLIEKRTEMHEDLIYRLRKRAEIRRQIPTRKSVQEGQADRIADLLDEAAEQIEHLTKVMELHRDAHHTCLELSNRAYHPKYDAYFHVITGEWLESNCGDPTCEYCQNRPRNAYE